MSIRTSSLIVEFLVSGVAYATALATLFYSLPFIDFSISAEESKMINQWIIPIFFLSGALFYILGFIFNYLAYIILKPVEKRVFRKYFKSSKSFRKAEAKLAIRNISEHQYQIFLNELGFLRLSRAITFIALLFSISAFIRYNWIIGIFISFLFVLAIWSVIYRSDRYFSIVLYATRNLEKNPTPTKNKVSK